MKLDTQCPVCGENHIDAVREQQILSRILTEDEAVDAASLFAHLSDTTRVRLLSMLSASEMCVCEMADILNMSQPAVSHHLRVLRQCGMVRFHKKGQRAVYYLSPDENGDKIKKLLAIVCGSQEK